MPEIPGKALWDRAKTVVRSHMPQRAGLGLTNTRDLNRAKQEAAKIAQLPPSPTLEDPIGTSAQVQGDLEKLRPHADVPFPVTRRDAIAAATGFAVAEGIRRVTSSESAELAKTRAELDDTKRKLGEATEQIKTLQGEKADLIKAKDAAESALNAERAKRLATDKEIEEARKIASEEAAKAKKAQEEARLAKEQERLAREAEEKAKADLERERKERQKAEDRLRDNEKVVDGMKEYERSHLMPDEFGRNTPTTSTNWRIRSAKPTESGILVEQPGVQNINFRNKNQLKFPSDNILGPLARAIGTDRLDDDTDISVHPRMNSGLKVTPRFDLVTKRDSKNEPSEIISFVLDPAKPQQDVIIERPGASGNSPKTWYLRFTSPPNESGYLTAKYMTRKD